MNNPFVAGEPFILLRGTDYATKDGRKVLRGETIHAIDAEEALRLYRTRDGGQQLMFAATRFLTDKNAPAAAG